MLDCAHRHDIDSFGVLCQFLQERALTIEIDFSDCNLDYDACKAIADYLSEDKVLQVGPLPPPP